MTKKHVFKSVMLRTCILVNSYKYHIAPPPLKIHDYNEYDEVSFFKYLAIKARYCNMMKKMWG